MSVITKDLGVATAYGYAKSKGYTGTEEEFSELMASYADVAQQAETAAQDAEDAKDAAVSAKTAAESAQTAAAGSAQTASTKATEASNSAQTAAGSAASASDSATAAAGSASTAQTAAQTATSKASEAASSASAASTAKTGAETARTGAQAAQTAAETAQANAETAAASVSASAAQIETNTEEIDTLKNDLNQFPNGNYPQMGAGYANQLVSGLKKEDNTPYNFRAVPYDATLEEVKKIIGGTIVNNQLAKEINSTNWRAETNVTATFENGIGSFTSTTVNHGIKCSTGVPVQGGHIYFGCTTIKAVSECDVRCLFGGTGGAAFDMTATASFAQYAKVVKASSGATGSSVFVFPLSDTGLNVLIDVKDILFKDVTQEFGTTIADYVYSLETATAGAGVAWLKKNFPKQFDSGYQAYDAGSMQSVSGLTAHKMVGFNQWDEVVEIGAINHSTGENVSGNVTIRSKNYIPCIPSMTYYFENLSNAGSPYVHYYDANKNFLSYTEVTRNTTFVVPSDAHYIRFNMDTGYGTTYNHDICINLHWDGEKDGTYEPYKTWSYALDDSVVIRGIPKVDASGNLYYDGDEYLPDGTVNRRYGLVDMGTLTWNKSQSEGTVDYFGAMLDGAVEDVYYSNKRQSIMSSAYTVTDTLTNSLATTLHENKTMVLASGLSAIRIRDDSYTDATTFKASLSGVMLVYELATPTTETASPYQATQIVDDWGTEEYVLSDGAFPVPVGHDTWYQNNLRAKLEMSPDSPDGDGLYVVQQESGENTYVPLASTATIQDILTRLTALENA